MRPVSMRRALSTVTVLMDSLEEIAYVLRISLLVSSRNSKYTNAYMVDSFSELSAKFLFLYLLSWPGEGAVWRNDRRWGPCAAADVLRCRNLCPSYTRRQGWHGFHGHFHWRCGCHGRILADRKGRLHAGWISEGTLDCLRPRFEKGPRNTSQLGWIRLNWRQETIPTIASLSGIYLGLGRYLKGLRVVYVYE